MTKGAQTRKEIVDRALTLAGEVGFAGLSLAPLAAEVKLSKADGRVLKMIHYK